MVGMSRIPKALGYFKLPFRTRRKAPPQAALFIVRQVPDHRVFVLGSELDLAERHRGEPAPFRQSAAIGDSATARAGNECRTGGPATRIQAAWDPDSR